MKRVKRLMTFVFIVTGLLVMLTSCEAPPDNGCGSTGAIGDKYAASGPYTAATTSITGFTIYYPRQMDGGHPIITWGNGTSAPTVTYSSFLRHLSSWGFVVIATNSTMTGSGDEMMEGVDYLIRQNRTPGSTFYGKLDTQKIATTGHSQGGYGAINAASESIVKTTVPIAPGPGNIGDVDCPIFLIAGSEDDIVQASMVRSLIYLRAKAPTIFGIAEGMGHLDFMGDMGNARGYITAWFMYQLKGDTNAGQAFVGSCELCSDSDWKVEKKGF